MYSSFKAIFFDAFTQSLTFLKNSRMMECVGLVAFKNKSLGGEVQVCC